MVSRTDVVAAARRIACHVHRTPVLTSRTIDALLGAEIHFKCENLQRSGAFKIRGAANAVLSLPADTEVVATHSSGNHGAALALAAAERGCARSSSCLGTRVLRNAPPSSATGRRS